MVAAPVGAHDARDEMGGGTSTSGVFRTISKGGGGAVSFRSVANRIESSVWLSASTLIP